MIKIWIKHNNGKEKQEIIGRITHPTSLGWPPRSGCKLGVAIKRFELGRIGCLLKTIVLVTKLETSISRSTKLKDLLVGFGS